MSLKTEYLQTAKFHAAEAARYAALAVSKPEKAIKFLDLVDRAIDAAAWNTARAAELN